MLEELGRRWGLFAFRGVLAIAFGVIAWVWPHVTVNVLVILFGAYALFDGVFDLGAALTGATGRSRGWLALAGLAGIIIGVIALFRPGDIAVVLVVLIGWWAIITGVLEIIVATLLRQEIAGEWYYILVGAISVLFGVILLVWPKHTVLGVVWIIGLFSIIFGVGLLVAALALRRLYHDRLPGD